MPKKRKEKAYKKCPTCGHTFWDMPAKKWGETGPQCSYCIEEELEQRSFDSLNDPDFPYSWESDDV